MAIQPTQPPRRDALGKALTIGGAIVGGVATVGSPAGIATGAGLGQTAASFTQRPEAQPIESQGMARRRESLDVDPVRAIAEAQAALRTLPPDQFGETRRAFNEALAIAQRNQQFAGRV